MMGTIDIAVDGEHVFNWQGDEAEAKHILEQFPRGAHHVGMKPEELCDEGIGQLLKEGRFSSESRVVREMQMMGVIWRILEMEINDPERPGKVADYIGNTNFDVDLQMHGEGVMATMAATSKLDS